MGKKKDCLFQFTITGGFPDYQPIEDTKRITYEQATKLWEKHLPRFIEALESEYSTPEMGIWINCKDDFDYHTLGVHGDKHSIARNGKIYEEKEIKP